VLPLAADADGLVAPAVPVGFVDDVLLDGDELALDAFARMNLVSLELEAPVVPVVPVAPEVGDSR
jgi:hypothetical protein